jgi:hypothetical protein
MTGTVDGSTTLIFTPAVGSMLASAYLVVQRSHKRCPYVLGCLVRVALGSTPWANVRRASAQALRAAVRERSGYAPQRHQLLFAGNAILPAPQHWSLLDSAAGTGRRHRPACRAWQPVLPCGSPRLTGAFWGYFPMAGGVFPASTPRYTPKKRSDSIGHCRTGTDNTGTKKPAK